MNTLWLRFTLITACILVASIATAALLVFAGTAAYMSLRDTTTPAFATAIVVLAGVTVIAVALTLAYLILGRDRAGRPPAQASRAAQEDRLVADVAELLGGELAQLIRSKPYAAAAASLAAGFAIGAVPELRHGLSALIQKR